MDYSFSVRADSFKVGQRVKLSLAATESGIRPGKRGGNIGIVKQIVNEYSILVHQNGYVKPHRFAAWFWQAI